VLLVFEAEVEVDGLAEVGESTRFAGVLGMALSRMSSKCSSRVGWWSCSGRLGMADMVAGVRCCN
jgi:hypothetical protein